MVAAGAGAGIAATFNTPLGGVMFALELMLPEVSSRTFLPVVIATGAATYFGWLFFGFEPAFLVPVTGLPESSFADSIAFFPFYIILGVDLRRRLRRLRAIAGLDGRAVRREAPG